MPPPYAELHAHSNFSFLTGASHPEELVQRAAELGYAALALTDECSVAGVVRAHGEAKRCGLHLIVGAEMRLSLPGAGPTATGPTPPPAVAGPAHARLVLLAQTRRGYGHLAHWITLARRRAEKGGYLAHPQDIEGKTPGAPMLAGLPECLALLVPAAGEPFERVFAQALWLKTWFGDRAGLAISRLHRAGDVELADTVQQVASHTGLPIVATGEVLMHSRARKALQDALSATRLRLPLADCGYALEPSAEAHLRPREQLAALYPPAWLEASVAWAGRCSFSLDELRYEYPQEIVPPGESPASWLRTLTWRGAREHRYPPSRFPDGPPPKVVAQIEHELALIAQLRYEPYFLTVADIVAWARGQGILCQGRGSAANSTVCYCLGVTEVDPDRMTTLFERFVSAERGEPPDIDIDFEHQRREEVIQYLYRKYGRHRAALTAVVISYRPRSALRDMGRALGLDLDRIDAVSKGHHWFDGRRVDIERLREHGFDPASPIVQRWVALTQQLVGFPRHLSQHPGGFVIAAEHLAQLVPVENAAMPDRSVVQWDKDDLDALGLLKVDILALGMLSATRRTLEMVGAKLGLHPPPDGSGTRLDECLPEGSPRFAVQDVPAEDPATYDMLCRADTVGVFQVESRAQMSMLPRLKPRTFYDLVVEVAIVRPGPIQGGMVHPYLRHRDLEPEEVPYPSDEVRAALERTRGVPIFQEQVMQLAMLAADFTPGEADRLRRAMAAWKRKGGLGPFHERLVGRMLQKGYEREFAERIFKQIEGFGEYGFPESHAASFALLAYVSAWLKCHHPDAFLAALLNSQPMGFYQPAQLVRDAREHEVQVLPVDVACSVWESVLVFDEAPPAQGASEPPTPSIHAPALRPVRLGLNRIVGLAEASAQRIVQARAADGPFENTEDLARRARLDARDLNLLAGADALATLAGHRHQAAWAVQGIDTRPTAMLRETRSPEPMAALEAPADAEETLADYRSLGLTLKQHPLALLRPQLDAFRVQPARVLKAFPNGRLARASGLVTHRQRPDTAKGTLFVTIEDDSGAVNVIVWPRVFDQYRRAVIAARLLTVYGTWQCEGEVRHLVASRLVDHSELLGGLASTSRDFR